MKKFDYEATKRPDFFQENREPPHSDHACLLPDGRSPYLSLNGSWYFHYAENYQGTIPDFYAPEVDCRGWDTIPVPSHIQLNGYGRPQYVNFQYPWDGREAVPPGRTPENYNPVGSYVRYFTLPDYMTGMRIFVSFQGAESGLAVWCNGQYVGYGEDGFTPSEFELTDYLRPGENKLAAQVFQYTAASWMEDQDFFRFSGLFREVFLYAAPAVHVRNLTITTELSADYTQAWVYLAMEAWGRGRVRCRLYDGDTAAAECGGVLGSGMELAVERPKLWSAERPTLYRLEVEVLDEDGQLTETLTEYTGLRRFEIRNGIMELNGRRILLRGGEPPRVFRGAGPVRHRGGDRAGYYHDETPQHQRRPHQSLPQPGLFLPSVRSVRLVRNRRDESGVPWLLEHDRRRADAGGTAYPRRPARMA